MGHSISLGGKDLFGFWVAQEDIETGELLESSSVDWFSRRWKSRLETEKKHMYKNTLLLKMVEFC